MIPASSGFLHFIQQADPVDRAILVVLALMSVGSWFLILRGAILHFCTRKQSARAWQRIQAPELPASTGDAATGGDLMQMLQAGLGSLAQWQRHLREGTATPVVGDPVERALDQSIADSLIAHERGLTYLACVAAAAPFIGLLGTVLGIYHALTAIGDSGEAGLSQVAGPVGEALLMTACGLACAIPAVLAYNFFVRANRVHLADMERFGHRLHARLTMERR